MLDIKEIRARLISHEGKPLPWAFIDVFPAPMISNGYLANTVFPTISTTRTNEYGIAVLNLIANSEYEMQGTKYLIRVSYDGRSQYFVINLDKVETSDIVDFEDLIDHAATNAYLQCIKNQEKEGTIKIIGTKVYI